MINSVLAKEKMGWKRSVYALTFGVYKRSARRHTQHIVIMGAKRGAEETDLTYEGIEKNVKEK